MIFLGLPNNLYTENISSFKDGVNNLPFLPFTFIGVISALKTPASLAEKKTTNNLKDFEQILMS